MCEKFYQKPGEPSIQANVSSFNSCKKEQLQCLIVQSEALNTQLFMQNIYTLLQVLIVEFPS